MENYRIRPANIKDAERLEALMKVAYSVYDKTLNGIILPPMNADYKDEIANYPTWIMEYEQDVIGGLIMYFDEEDAHLFNVAIDPVYKGKGFGRILIDFAESTALEKGYEYLNLVTHIKLVDNIRYYNKLGYKEIGRDENKVYFRKLLKD